MKTVNIVKIAMLLLIMIMNGRLLAGEKYVYSGVGPVEQYVPSGPHETSVLQKELFDLVGCYAAGIYPRPDILAQGVPGVDLPQVYTQKIDEWLRMVLKPGLAPHEFDRSWCVGLRKLHMNLNTVVGRLPSEPRSEAYIGFDVMFQAWDGCLNLTVKSASQFTLEPNSLSGNAIRHYAGMVLNIPDSNLPQIAIESHVRSINGTMVCYGKMRRNFDERRDIAPQQWWDYIPFWYTKGTMFVSVSTIDWKKRLPASTTVPWRF